MDDDSHDLTLVRAFIRGRAPELARLDDDAMIEAALAQGLRLHKFKRTAMLPRVQRVLGILEGLEPTSILDVGSGRGVFLWPLLETIRGIAVTAVDHDPIRVRDLQAVAAGGIARLAGVEADAAALPWPAASFDIVTALEVLEHVDDAVPVARELLRVARRFVVVSVPSQPDDNPEHVRLFDGDTLSRLFLDLGAPRVQLAWVPGHIIAIVARAR
ncbi:MAG: class I SAM-dependent methyltransferase [Deltaproteobacteria bacterium]|nr:class I SAM-dependent methyltransferase [Deltaproteobacteria bacterium]MBK8719814.1 class I SAM-dependent methyltransferase [Deltaproteobacteria bacterium]MBP7285209.1 class I SAM-dependent methyltransferase [Nannocystaceae bacterium]